MIFLPFFILIMALTLYIGPRYLRAIEVARATRVEVWRQACDGCDEGAPDVEIRSRTARHERGVRAHVPVFRPFHESATVRPIEHAMTGEVTRPAALGGGVSRFDFAMQTACNETRDALDDDRRYAILDAFCRATPFCDEETARRRAGR